MDNLFRNVFSASSLNRWKIQNLDYNWYTALSILFGWCGLDQLYLGSPLTAILKTIVNLVTFGYWWFYDALMAVFAQDRIKLFGTAAPAIGPTGIGACRFRDETDPVGDPATLDKHLNFMLYGIALMFGGFLGIDQLLIGEYFNCFLHICAMASLLGIPLAFGAHAIRGYSYVFDTNSDINKNWAFFGAPKPAKGSECPNILMLITMWIVKTFLAGAKMVPGLGLIATLLETFLRNLEIAYGIVNDVKEQVVETVEKAASVGRQVSSMNPPPAAEVKAAAKQTGGMATPPAWIPMTSLLLAGTIGFIVVSSLIISIRRSFQKQDAATTAVQQPGEDDDVPPEPGVPRVPESTEDEPTGSAPGR
uniref:TM2 domain-containing protein n=1 Tax=viral metagenome TaxID=1070528 RepID=A0A6C0K2W0_9ZZZZ